MVSPRAVEKKFGAAQSFRVAGDLAARSDAVSARLFGRATSGPSGAAFDAASGSENEKAMGKMATAGVAG